MLNQFDPTLETDAIVADQREVMRRIVNHPVEVDPCHYLVIDDIFPADLYAQIVRMWPADSCFQKINTTGRVSAGGYSARSVLMLSDHRRTDGLPPEQREFWGLMTRWMNSQDFAKALCQKFYDLLIQIHGKDFFLRNFAPRPQLVIDDGYYDLPPHTDEEHRVMGLLFYCPADEAISDQGTSLYRLKPESRIVAGEHPSEKILPRSEFDLVKTVEFRPNRLFLFVRSPVSYHGVEPTQTDGRRRTLSWKLLVQ